MGLGAEGASVVAEVKAYLRLNGSGEDALLAGLAESAAALCESFTGRVLIAGEVSETVTVTGGWVRVRRSPVSAIGAVTQGGAALAAGAYAVDVDAGGDGWVRLACGVRADVRYTAGLAADWNGVPAPLRQGVVRLAAHLFGDRGPEQASPAAVTALWRPWRRLSLGRTGREVQHVV